MTQYFGDFSEDATVYIPFNTFDSNDPSASVTITNLADADIHVHKDGSATQITTDGATVSIDFDTITGNHIITVDTSASADYTTGSDYLVRIEGTTVDAATINAWVGSFSIENRHSAGALRPTTAGRTLDVSSTGEAGVDFDNVNLPLGAIPSLGIVDNGTAQAATGTTIRLRAAAAFADDELIGSTVLVTGGSAGVGQARIITDYVSATDTATVDAWTTTPTGTITYSIIGTPPASSNSPAPVNVTQVNGSAQDLPTATALAVVDSNVDGIKAKTDDLTFTSGTDLDCNIQKINDVALTGNGGSGTEFTIV